MLDQIKKTMSAGVDLALKTKDEVEDLAKELIEKGKMSEKEGRKLFDDLLKRYDEAKKKLETMIETRVREVLSAVNLAHKDDLKSLKEEIDRLKASVDALDKKSGN